MRVGEQILQAGEEERAELSFLPIGAGIDFVLDEIGEKTLSQVLGIMRGIAAMTNKGIKRWPVSLTKLAERRARNLRRTFGFSGREDDTPFGGGERVARFPDGSRQRGHAQGLAERFGKGKRRK